MSAFLGPIHHKMYEKITLQNQLVNHLDSKGNNISFHEKLQENTVDFHGRELEDVVDHTNIHGSLQSMISAVESKLAFAVANLTADNIMSQEQILKETEIYGEAHLISAESLEDVYSKLSDVLLDGMPCDKVVHVVESTDQHIIWRDEQDIHSSFWQQEDMDPECFYLIRLSLISGMIGSNFRIEYLGDRSFRLSRRFSIHNSIDVLIHEHNNIVNMLQILKNQTIRFMNKEDVNLQFYRDFIDFTRNYADKHHHGKEEKILFKYMTETLGPVAEKLVTHGMLVEHDMGRYYVTTLENAIESFEETGSDEDRLTIIMAAMAYSDLLKRHVDKENEVVYTFAERSLTEEIMNQIEEETVEFESEYSERKNKYESSLRKLQQYS